MGGGSIISGAAEEVRELAHHIQAPVCDTLMGKGAFPGTDKLYTGISVCTEQKHRTMA